MRPFSLIGLFATLLAGAGCSSEPPGSDGTGGPAQCDPGPGYATPAEPQLVASLSATLVDLDEQPLVDEMVQLCGTDVCVAGTSSANGGVVMGSTQPITKPAFKFGEGKQSPRFALLLPEEEEVDLGTVHTVRLPPMASGVPLVAGEEASSGGVHVFPAAGSSIKFDKLTFSLPEEQRFRAVRVPHEELPELVDPALNFDVVVATTPTDTLFCPPAKLSVDNDDAFAPGTTFEVFLHGVGIEQEWAPYGGWAKVSDAEVSADGARIETTSPGLPLLGVIGLRRR